MPPGASTKIRRGIEIVRRLTGQLPAAWLGVWSAGIFALAVRRGGADRSGGLAQSVAVIGAGPSADRLMRQWRRGQGPSVEILGLFDDRAERVPRGSMVPHGSVEDLIVLARSRRVDWVVIALPWSAEARVAQMLNRVQALAAEVTLCPPMARGVPAVGEADVVQDPPFALLRRRPWR